MEGNVQIVLLKKGKKYNMEKFVGDIIDFEIKGNAVKFYLGTKDNEWGWTNKNYKDSSGATPDWLEPSDKYYGDDWNDCPYEHNAETVHSRFIYGTRTFYYDFDWIIVEPCSGTSNSIYCKNDFKKRIVPCVIVIKGNLAKDYSYKDSFSFWWDFINNNDYDKEEIECFYFEDILMSGETLETEHSNITI